MDSLARIGEPAPSFKLADLDGKQRSLDDWRGSIVVLNFWSAECVHSRRTDEVLEELARGWGSDVLLCYIAANDSEGNDLVRQVADGGKVAHLLRDQDNRVADSYGAITTPHVFVIDSEGVLRYSGGLDDVSLRQRTPTRNYLIKAVRAIKNGQDPDPSETEPFGCAIVRIQP